LQGSDDRLEQLQSRYKPYSGFGYPSTISIFLAVISGFLLASAQELQLPGARFVAFIGLVPLLIAIEKKRSITTFFLSLLAFYVYLIQPLWWISRYGLLPIMGLTFMEATVYSLAFVLYNFIRSRSDDKDPWFMILPMLIAIVDLKRAIGPWAFPWTYFAHSQTASLIFVQGASLWGAIGVSFLVIWINVFVFNIIKAYPTRIRDMAQGIPLILILLFNFYYGYLRLHDDSFKTGPPVPLTITQRKTATDVAWSGDFMSTAWSEYESLTRKEIDNSADKPGMVLWPENAVPDLIPFRQPGVEHLATTYNKSFVIGTLTFKPDWADSDADFYEPWYELYNSAVVINPKTGYNGTYSKVHPVPFGETIPMRDYLSLLEYPWGDKNLSAGKEIISLPTPNGNVGAMICYESFFPQIPRKLVLDGARYLFLVSNTSWFGDSVATWQHSRYDIFRAIENNCYFGRAASTGVSSVIDPRGRIIRETQPFVSESFTVDVYPSQDFFPRGFFTSIFPWSGQLGKFTPYTILGDWVAYLSLIWLVIKLMRIFRPKSAKPITQTIAYIED
jgi:apolipoprotein N-acyltransferase